MRDRARDERGNVKRRNSESTGIELHTSLKRRDTYKERAREEGVKNGLINDKNEFGRITSKYI